MIASLALALLALLQIAPQDGSLRGRVRSESTGAAIPGAVVELVDRRAAATATADSSGAYVLRDVPAGRHRVRARQLGYAPLEVEVMVAAGREVAVDITLRPTPIVLEPVRVNGVGTRSATDTVAAPRAELGLAGARAMEGTPGLAEMGLAEVARGVPGQEPVDPADVLYVRGTGADLKLVYLDGAPVYAPFPLGGLLDAFAPGLLRSADLYLGGAPARYDGGLSYILDLRTRGPHTDRTHTSGAMDMLAARALVEAPFGSRSGIMMAGRTVHDVGTGRLTEAPLPYDYREGLVRADIAVGEGAVSLMAFGNGERVWLDGSGVNDRAIQWGNTAVSARYRGTLAGTGVELTAAAGDFRAGLPLSGQQLRVAEGASRRSRFAADLMRRRADLTFRYGASFDRQHQEYRWRHADTSGPWEPVGSRAVADAAGAYVDLGWQVAPEVRLRGGMRADYFSLDGDFRLAPRLSATWLLSERAALTLAAGRYHQYLRQPESRLFADSSGVITPLVLGGASHVSLALDQELGVGMRLGVEGFYKSFQRVPEAQATDAHASGVDVWVRRSSGAWTGWAGYSLAWTWSPAEGQEPGRFAGRHLLSTGLGAPLGEEGKLELGFVYGAGLPYSAIPFAQSVELSGGPQTLASRQRNDSFQGAAGNAPLLPSPTRPYLRLDLSASRTWSREWGGTPMELTPYVKLMNTLGQRDALFYRYEHDQNQEPRPVLLLPLVPVLGVEWKF